MVENNIWPQKNIFGSSFLAQKYYAAQVRTNQGSISWPLDHDSTLDITETPVLSIRPSVTWDSAIRNWLIKSSSVIYIKLHC